MKCLCGYERISEWSEWEFEQAIEQNPDFVNGEEAFIESNSSMNFQMRESDYSSDGSSNCTIYACPKCGTLKIDI